MNLGKMKSEARAIFGQPDAANSSITDIQLEGWANEFYRKAVVYLESVRISENTYDISGATVSFDVSTVLINLAKFKIQPENKWVEIEVKDLDDLFRRDPDWENATTGKPDWLVRTGTFTGRLYPPPNTANDNQTGGLKTYGVELPDPTGFNEDSNSPTLPENIEDLFPYFMAYKAFMALGEYEKAGAQLAIANEGLKSQRNISTQFSNSKGWQWHDRDPGADD